MAKIDINTINKMNERLKNAPGLSLSRLLKEMNIPKGSFYRDIGKSYKFDNETKQLVKTDDETAATKTDKTENIQPSETLRVVKSAAVEEKADPDKFEALEARIGALEEILKDMDTKTYKSDFELNSKVLTGEIITRSIKVNGEIMKDFTKFCDTKLKAYTKQDLISQALLEFIERYSFLK